MGVLATNKNQIIYIYSEDSILGKKLLPYVESSKKPTRVININVEKITGTIWAEILELLNIDFKGLLRLDEVKNEGNNDFSSYTFNDFLKIVEHQPSVLQNPIVVLGDKVYLINNRSDFNQFYDADGANFDKSTEAIKNANHKDTTGDKKQLAYQFENISYLIYENRISLV